jgi:leader peptidase (prepilin peptidase)/N-methyltransferase
MMIVAAALAGSAVGWVRARRLEALDYRRRDETVRPAPAARWWVIPGLGCAWAWLEFTLAEQPTLIVMWLPLAAALGWVAAVDLDVQRIPKRVLGPAAAWVGLCVAALALNEVNWDAVTRGVLAGAGCFLGFAVLHVASQGGLGFGGVKLAALLGVAVGVISPTTLLAALLLGCVLALVWAAITRTRQLPFGPWLGLGAVIAAGLPGF